MPQLDASTFPSQLFWLALSFALLYVLLSQFLLPQVQTVLARRSFTLDDDLGAASRMKAEAEAAQIAYDRTFAEARRRSTELLAQMQAALAGDAARRQAELERDVAARLAASDREIQSARAASMASLTPVAAEVASLIVQAITHHAPDAKETAQVVETIAREPRA